MSQKIIKILIVICIIWILVMVALIFLTKSSKHKISIHSDINTISLAIKDNEVLDKLTNSWGIFTKKIVLSNTTSDPKSINSIRIVLTPNIQSADVFLAPDGQTVIQSTGHTYKDGLLTIMVYLDPKEILSRKEDEIAQWILHASLLRIYSITVNENLNQDDFSNQMWKYVSSASEIIDVKKI